MKESEKDTSFLFPRACPYTLLCQLSKLPDVFLLCSTVPYGLSHRSFPRILPNLQNRTKCFMLYKIIKLLYLYNQDTCACVLGRPTLKTHFTYVTYLFQLFTPDSTAQFCLWSRCFLKFCPKQIKLAESGVFFYSTKSCTSISKQEQYQLYIVD